jgi:hypothetical protein
LTNESYFCVDLLINNIAYIFKIFSRNSSGKYNIGRLSAFIWLFIVSGDELMCFLKICMFNYHINKDILDNKIIQDDINPIFRNKYEFQSDLSILDLIFNMGNKSLRYLQEA